MSEGATPLIGLTREGRRLDSRGRTAFRHALVAVAFVLFWHLFVHVFNIPRYLVPSPAAVGETMARNWGLLFSDSGITLLEAVGGFLLGVSMAFVLSAVFIYLPRFEILMAPYIVALQAVPLVAMAPLLIIWFGNGYMAKIALAALVSFFPVTISTTVGLKRVRPEALEVMRLLSATRSQILIMLRIPSALPFIFSGLRISAALSVIGAIVAELAGATKGLGHTIMIASYRTDTPMLFAAIILACAASIGFHGCVQLLQAAVLRHHGAQGI